MKCPSGFKVTLSEEKRCDVISWRLVVMFHLCHRYLIRGDRLAGIRLPLQAPKTNVFLTGAHHTICVVLVHAEYGVYWSQTSANSISPYRAGTEGTSPNQASTLFLSPYQTELYYS